MDVKDIHKRLSDAIQHLERSLPIEIDELRILFVATGPLQETAMSNGWADEFLVLAARFDKLIQESPSTPTNRQHDTGLLVFKLLAVVALAIPHLALVFFGVYWSALVAVLVLILWGRTMPTTCMSGGLICSIVMLSIVGNTAGLTIVAIGRMVLWISGMV